jgi:hypothetical protein
MNQRTRAASADRPDRSKKTRTPLGARNRLTFSNLDPEFQYRVINDVDDRLMRAQEAGYEFVESPEQLGDKKVAEASKIGTSVSKPVGNGTIGYLMRIPKKWYEEDQAAKQKQIDQTEAALKPETQKDQYGPGLTNE